jgi:hypothetical protein
MQLRLFGDHPMKTLTLVAAILLALCGAAHAACPTPLTVKDASAATQNVATIDDANGSCVGGVYLQATTTGGCTPYHLSGGTAASTNATVIKSSAGNLCRLTVINDGTGSSTVVYYIKLYDTGTTPTCSSATGLKHVYPIPVSAFGAGISFVDVTG